MQHLDNSILDNPRPIHINGPDHRRIPAYLWQPEITPVATIHISHGMAEHALRYHELALTLNRAGFIVYAQDHPGHGANIQKNQPETRGHFADSGGWSFAVNNIAGTVDFIKSQHPHLPCFLLGHSMGSYLLQSYLINHNPAVSGVILSGSNLVPGPLLFVARTLAQLEVWRQGRSGLSPLIHRLVFGRYNRAFKPNRTDFDWLSRNPDQVDAYINDPLCGFPCSNQLWVDLFSGLQEICSVQALTKMDKKCPVLVLGGEQDPVSAPKGQQKLAAAIKEAGVEQVSTEIYPKGRHEMFNDINGEQVVQRLIQWMDEKINNQLTQPMSEPDA